MKLNLILSGIKQNNSKTAFRRLQFALRQLPENTKLQCLFLGEKEDAEAALRWAGQYRNAVFYLAKEGSCLRESCEIAKQFINTMEEADASLLYAAEDGAECGRQMAAALGLPVFINTDYLERNGNKLYAVRQVFSAHAEGVFYAEHALVVIAVSGAGTDWEEKETEAVIPKPFSAVIEEVGKKSFAVIRSKALVKTENLADARIVFLGGKGLGSKSGFARMEALAKKLGVSVACSRLAALSGYAGYEHVVGVSGVQLNADLCIAFGVSGAGPLMYGLKNVKKLIAVNTDPNAPIFRHAQYGIKEDSQKVMEELEALLKEKTKNIKL